MRRKMLLKRLDVTIQSFLNNGATLPAVSIESSVADNDNVRAAIETQLKLLHGPPVYYDVSFEFLLLTGISIIFIRFLC